MKSPRVGSVLLLLAPAAALAADERIVQQAIDRGVVYLKKHQDARGNWTMRGESTPGATALAGLTLLECDVPPSDRAIQRAADALRPATVSLTHTYSLALAILFLDRLGESFDDALIQSMGVRLLAGQRNSGGWTYVCPAPPREEVARLTKHLGQHRLTATGRGSKPATTVDNRPALPKELQSLVAKINPEADPRPTETDNSNTKFATLALWVARRHGVPVELALARVERRFRNSQNGDGGWGYFPPGHRVMGQSLASMTCAGLLGLAFGHASATEVTLRTQPRGNAAAPKMSEEALDPARDPSIRAGLLYLARVVGEPLDRVNASHLLHNAKGDEYYFLWAVERVAVAYGINTIGDKDWFDWGAKYLLSRQAKNGSWVGRLQANVDTCFALLFLRRANLSRDLTATLKGQINDPSQVGLRGTKENKPAKPAPTTATPVPDIDAEIARLTKALIDASAEKQKAMIGEYEKAKGVAYTQALATAIAKLNPAHQKQARDALTQRLARMTTATLAYRLKDGDPEMRRAAALASAMKEEKSHVPQLIPLLNDSDMRVARAAHAALKSLTGKDFGPAANADRGERQRAIEDWTKWWKAERGDSGG